MIAVGQEVLYREKPGVVYDQLATVTQVTHHCTRCTVIIDGVTKKFSMRGYYTVFWSEANGGLASICVCPVLIKVTKARIQ